MFSEFLEFAGEYLGSFLVVFMFAIGLIAGIILVGNDFILKKKTGKKEWSKKSRKRMLCFYTVVGLIIVSITIFGIIEGSLRTWGFLVDIVGNFAMGGFLIYYSGYIAEKTEEYENDERWQMITTKVNYWIAQYYFLAIMITVVTLLIFPTILNVFIDIPDVNVSLQRVLQVTLFILSSRYLFEIIVLKSYDKKM